MHRCRRPVRRDLALAAALSIAVHAALVLVLVQGKPRSGAPALDVELVTFPAIPVPTPTPTPTATPAPTATPTPTPTATATATATPTATPTPTPTSTATPTSTSTATSTATATATTGEPTTPALDWLRDHGLDPSPRPAVPGALATPVPRELVPPAPDPRRDANRVLAAIVDAARAEDLARHPDAATLDVRERLLDGFAPGFDVLGQVGGAGTGGFLAGVARAYAATAERYGTVANPYLPSPAAPGSSGAAKAAAARAAAEGSHLREDLAVALDALGAAAEAAVTDGWTRRLVTAVAIEVDAEGRVTAARIADPSGSAGHDRLALAQAVALVGQLVGARLASSTTEWILVTDFSVVPPLPMIGFGFDANFKPTQLVYPLKRSTRSKVSLVSVRRAG